MDSAELLLRKDEALPLPDQISGILRERIVSGEYAPGKRLGSVRQFAGDFDVSPVTVIKALDILESEALIRRIPMKGIYVSERLKGENRQLNICFAFPEKEMSPEVLQKENWALSSELQRGLLSAAAGKNAVLQFVYFEDHPEPGGLNRQTAELKKYDMVIFVGHQLEQLQREIAGVIPAFRMVGDKNETIPASMIPVDYDRDAVFLRLARHIRACGCRTAGMIGMHSGETAKSAMFQSACEACGIAVKDRFFWRFDTVDHEILAEKLKGERPDFIYCMHSDLVPDIYEAAFQCGLKIGRDFQTAGIATGVTFSGLLPQYTYFRIPRFEMGYRIMSEGIEAVRSGKELSSLPLFHAELIQGKSTCPIYEEE